MNDVKHGLRELYRIVDDLSDEVGGPRQLKGTSRRDGWPRRGVYLVFEPGEDRLIGSGPRTVRIGTHALKSGARSTLWGRLSQHRGRGERGGSHRSSVFRKHIGAALLSLEDPRPGTEQWGRGPSAPRDVRDREHPHELRVNQAIGRMAVLWLAIEDDPRPASDRGFIERNLVALLSTAHRTGLERPSGEWLGWHARSPAIPVSGLWNVRHVDDAYDPSVLDALEVYAGETAR